MSDDVGEDPTRCSSPVRFHGKIFRIAPISRDFRRKTARFLCGCRLRGHGRREDPTLAVAAFYNTGEAFSRVLELRRVDYLSMIAFRPGLRMCK
jgi:hypothetical protein